MKKPVLIVADAPGGPHPHFYLPSLRAEFEVHAVWLDVEAPVARQRRESAWNAVAEAGGVVRTVSHPQDLMGELNRMITETLADGVVAYSERIVHLAQRVARMHGLPSNNPAVLAALQDKRHQRARMRAAGLRTPKLQELRVRADVDAAAKEFTFPAVLKPSVGMGSAATFRVDKPTSLLTTWEHASALVASDLRIAHHNPVMLLEEEMQGDASRVWGGLGDYVSVEALVVDGEVRILTVQDKLPLSYPFRENGHLMPAHRPAAECDEIIDYVRDVHTALDVVFGATHTEVKLTREGPALIEVNGRIGGGVAEQLALNAGYDLTLNLARASTGQPADTSVPFSRWSAYLTLQPPMGHHRVTRAPTVEDLKSIPEVDSVLQIAGAGSVVNSDTGTASNIVRILVASESQQRVIQLANELREQFRFEPIDPTSPQTPLISRTVTDSTARSV